MCKSVEGNCTLRHCVALGTHTHNACDLHPAHTVLGRQHTYFCGMPVFSAMRRCRQVVAAALVVGIGARLEQNTEGPAEKCQAKHTCFLPVFSAIQRCVAHDAPIVNLRVRVLVLLHKILIPAKNLQAKHTYFLPVFGAIQRCAAHDAAIVNSRVRVLVLLHKILIPAEKWQAKHTCFLPVFGAMRCP